jgi:hypothetical protein
VPTALLSGGAVLLYMNLGQEFIPRLYLAAMANFELQSHLYQREKGLFEKKIPTLKRASAVNGS